MNELINRQLLFGTKLNTFRALCDKSKPVPTSPRVKQVLDYIRLGYPSVPEPMHCDTKLARVKEYPRSRQMRYFGAWCLDQWDHAADELRRSNVSEGYINRYKDDFISVLHDDFDSGKAYEYADDWYRAFPTGGYYNPIRYSMIYEDETDIANKVGEYLRCRLAHPAVADFMRYPKPERFDHTISEIDGGILVAYKHGSPVRDILADHVDSIDTYVSELIGEEEKSHEQRIFVTDSVLTDKTNDLDTCVVYFSDFNTYEPETLMSSVKAAVSETIPMEHWRKSGVMIDTKKVCVSYGQIKMCHMYLETREQQPSYPTDFTLVNSTLDETLAPNTCQSKQNGYAAGFE